MKTKTIILTTCWINSDEKLKRHTDWLDWHLPMLYKLGVDEIWWMDNVSDPNYLDKLKPKSIINQKLETEWYKFDNSKLNIYQYSEHLGRNSVWDYPYSWRALYDLPKLAKFTGATKIISIDTDFYVLSQKCMDWFKNTNEGWQAAWCPTYNFPETAFSILSDISLLEKFISENPDYRKLNGTKTMEFLLPYTNINKELIGDRYAELNKSIPHNADFCGQQETKPFIK